MGIPKVTGFMKHNYDWKRRNFRGSQIVIGGYSLCYHLYSENHGWQLGGEYREFYQTVTSYFQQLHRIGIDPYIVIDGVDHDNSKYATNIKKCEQKIERIARMSFDDTTTVSETVLPLLAKTVFVDALRDFDLKFFVADGDADQEVVALANELHCPIMGRDSDFYIFNVEGGYIPITDPVDGGNMVDLNREVRFFYYRDFDANFCDDKDLRLFLPFILGNDFLDGFDMPTLRIDCKTALHKILSTVKRRCSGDHRADEHILRRQGENAVEQMEHVRSYYRVKQCSFIDLSTSRYLCRISSDTPRWVVELFKKGQILCVVMQFLVCQGNKTWCYTNVVEDVKQPSAWDVSRRVRYYILALLLRGIESQTIQIRETVRQVTSPAVQSSYCLVHENVALDQLKGLHIQYDLASLPSQPLEARRNFLLKVLQCDDVFDIIKAIPEDLMLVVAASRCWFRSVRRDRVAKLIVPLVICILSCNGKIDIPDVSGNVPDRLSLVHALAQWQCVLHDAIALNQVLCQPFTYTSPGKLFSAVVMEKLVAR